MIPYPLFPRTFKRDQRTGSSVCSVNAAALQAHRAQMLGLTPRPHRVTVILGASRSAAPVAVANVTEIGRGEWGMVQERKSGSEINRNSKIHKVSSSSASLSVHRVLQPVALDPETPNALQREEHPSRPKTERSTRGLGPVLNAPPPPTLGKRIYIYVCIVYLT